MIQPTEIVLVGLLGGILNLDRTAFLQSMASRPLVGSTLAGMLLGEALLGFRCGLLLELLWLMDLPVGGSVPPDDCLAGVVAAALAAAAPSAWGIGARAAGGVLLALPFGWLGRRLDLAVRRANGRLLAVARDCATTGSPACLTRLHLTGALRFFGVGAAAAALGASGGSWAVASLARVAPAGVPSALEAAGYLLPVIGVGAVLAALPGRRRRALFGGGLAAGLGLTSLVPGKG